MAVGESEGGRMIFIQAEKRWEFETGEAVCSSP
jgi:hypothetical protein